MIRIAKRYHDICAGHRVVGHENRCKQLHGHNYRIIFYCAGNLDDIGRVIDFSEIKSRLCNWLEENWDHRFLVWTEDPYSSQLRKIDLSVVEVPFNPTAENIAEYLVSIIGPQQLEGTGITLIECEVQETRKCAASFSISK